MGVVLRRLLKYGRGLKMPKKLEAELVRKAHRMGLTGSRKDAYVYGALRKTGWKPSREKKRG